MEEIQLALLPSGLEFPNLKVVQKSLNLEERKEREEREKKERRKRKKETEHPPPKKS